MRMVSDKWRLPAGVKPMMRSFMRLGSSLCIAVGLGMLLVSNAADRKPAGPATQTKSFWPTYTCKGCHDQIVAQHLESEHEKSFTNPAFQAQYQKDGKTAWVLDEKGKPLPKNYIPLEKLRQ